MIKERINLKDIYSMLPNDCFIESYCIDNYDEFSKNELRKTVLVIPGGAYVWCSDRECEPVALKLLGNDINTFTIKYSCKEKINHPAPFVEVFAAIAYIRKNYKHYNVNPDSISVIGFSAGGHLAGYCSATWQNKEYASFLNETNENIKINGCILGYPVIANRFKHAESFDNISMHKGNYDDYSVEKLVTDNFPKTYIWHTTFDDCVPVMNSICLAEELTKNKVFYELHVMPMGGHGQSLADKSVYYKTLEDKYLNTIAYNTRWVEEAIHFIKEYL